MDRDQLDQVERQIRSASAVLRKALAALQDIEVARHEERIPGEFSKSPLPLFFPCSRDLLAVEEPPVCGPTGGSMPLVVRQHRARYQWKPATEWSIAGWKLRTQEDEVPPKLGDAPKPKLTRFIPYYADPLRRFPPWPEFTPPSVLQHPERYIWQRGTEEFNAGWRLKED